MFYWQDMKNFVEQIPIKFGCFFVIKMNKLCRRQTPKYRLKFGTSADLILILRVLTINLFNCLSEKF